MSCAVRVCALIIYSGRRPDAPGRPRVTGHGRLTPNTPHGTAQTAARLTGPERGRDRLDRRATRRARGYAATAALAALPDAPRAPARAARLCGRDPRRRVFN